MLVHFPASQLVTDSVICYGWTSIIVSSHNIGLPSRTAEAKSPRESVVVKTLCAFCCHVQSSFYSFRLRVIANNVQWKWINLTANDGWKVEVERKNVERKCRSAVTIYRASEHSSYAPGFTVAETFYACQAWNIIIATNYWTLLLHLPTLVTCTSESSCGTSCVSAIQLSLELTRRCIERNMKRSHDTYMEFSRVLNAQVIASLFITVTTCVQIKRQPMTSYESTAVLMTLPLHTKWLQSIVTEICHDKNPELNPNPNPNPNPKPRRVFVMATFCHGG